MKKEVLALFGGCLLLGVAGIASAEMITLDGEQLMDTHKKFSNYDAVAPTFNQITSLEQDGDVVRFGGYWVEIGT